MQRSGLHPPTGPFPGARVVTLIKDGCKDDGVRWVSLPIGGPARWTLPALPRRLARAGLMVHQPMRLRARVGWELARTAAGLGAFRLLPASSEPELQHTLAEFIPPGGSVAVAAHLHRAGRAVALLLDRDGRSRGLAKIAHDPAGRAKLAHEAATLSRFGPLVERPLRAPELLAVRDGVVVFEVADWTPRLRPWDLPPELAAAIGRFHRQCVDNGPGGRGPTHGDFAPWNILRIRDGWFLIDWEDATDDGPGFADPLHYLVQSHALLGRPSARELLDGVRGRGRIGEAIHAYAEAAGVRLNDAPRALSNYLVTSQANFHPQGAEGCRAIEARHALLRSVERGRAPAPTTAVAARRTFWGLADQALSSLTNFVLAIEVARQVNPVQFGAFGLAFAAYLVALTVSRAVATEPLTIRYSARDVGVRHVAMGKATGTALVMGALSGFTCLAGAAVIGGDVGSALAPLAIALPALLVQDAWRFAFFAAGRGRDAFVNDLVWALVLVIALAVVTVTAQGGITEYILAWAAGGLAGALFGIAQTHVVPAPRAMRAWLREHRDLAPRLAIEALILSGTQQVLLVAIGIVAGLASVAAVRAGQILLNALHIVTFGLYLAVVPEAVRVLQRSAAALRRLCILVASGLAAITILWGIVLFALPASIGQALLGETWDSAHQLIIPLALVNAAAGVQTGAVVGLRALASASRSLQARSASSALMFAGGFVGAELGGAIGTAWGMALGVTAGAFVWWFQLALALAEGKRPQFSTLQGSSESEDTM